MKFNLDKVNNFLDNDSIDDTTKNFVINLFKIFCKNDAECVVSKILFLDLGFYEVDKKDLEDEYEDDLKVIDFYKISTLNTDLKKMVLNYMLKTMQKSRDGSDFAESFFGEDLKIIIPYNDWKKVNRKNKLDNLNKLNEN